MIHRSLFAIIFAFTSTLAFAHGEGQHVLGTVTTIDQTRLEIKTQKGAIVELQLNKQTRFKEKGNPKGTYSAGSSRDTDSRGGVNHRTTHHLI